MNCEGAVAQRPRRPIRKYKIRGIWRLELDCHHTAYSLISEPHHEGFARFCYVCGQWVVILSSIESRFKVSDNPPRTSMKNHGLD